MKDVGGHLPGIFEKKNLSTLLYKGRMEKVKTITTKVDWSS